MSSQKWSQFPTATILQDADLLAIVQSGINKKISAFALQQLLTAVPSEAIVGTTTNDNAEAGYVGEVIQSSVEEGTGTPLENATPVNLVTITLTPGDWDVSAYAGFDFSVASVTQLYATCSCPDATDPNMQGAEFLDDSNAYVASNTSIVGSAATFQVQVAAETTSDVTLSVVADLSAGSVTPWGGVFARRMR